MTEQQPQKTLTIETQKVTVPIPFFANIPANQRLTLVSDPISVHFVVKEVEIHFRDDTANNLRVYVYNANNRSAPATAPPPDTNMISSLSPTPYLVGEGEILRFPMNYTPPPNYMYLKVHFENNNAYAITCLAVITIEGTLKYPVNDKDIVPITTEQEKTITEFQSNLLAKAKASIDVATNVMQGTPLIVGTAIKALQTQEKDTSEGMVEKYRNLTEITKVVPKDVHMMERPKYAEAWMNNVVDLSHEVSTSNALVNMITGAFGGSVWNYEQWLNSLFGLTSKVQEMYTMGIDSALLKPMQYMWNEIYQTEIPTTTQLIRMVMREQIPFDEYKNVGHMLGYGDYWLNKFYEIEKPLLGVGEIQQLVRRKMMGFDDGKERITNLGYDVPEADFLTRLSDEIPQTADLINMVVKEKIDLPEFKKYMNQQGLSDYWAQKIWDAHFIAPDFDTAKRAYWRGKITKAELPEFLKLVDLDPAYNEKVWLALTEEIPQYADLINMRVKEVISQEDFKKGLEYQGYFGVWADRLWDAHFTPPTFADFLTAMRRKSQVQYVKEGGTVVTHTFGLDPYKDMSAIEELSILADYDPRYWSFFKTRIYNDPTPRMAQWGYEAGVINESTLKDIVHRFGYTPDVENWYADMLIHFRDRAWNNKYLTQLMTNYVNKALTYEELEQKVVEVTNNKTIAEIMRKIGDLRIQLHSKSGTETKEKLISLAELKQMFFRNIINVDAFRTELLNRDYTLIDTDNLIALLQAQKDEYVSGGTKEGLTVAELFDAFRYDFISEDTLKGNLMSRGMILSDIEILIKTKKAKWGIGLQGD